VKNTKSVLKQLIKEELEGLGPRKGAMSGLPGSTASQRRYSRRAGELEADRMTHGMDINPYQALADQAIAEIEGSVVNRGMARPALDKLIQAAESDPDAKAVLDAVQSETGLSIGRMSAVATMPRMAPQLSPAERDAATMQENYKPILGGSKMKITKSALKRLIKEELANLEEQMPEQGAGGPQASVGDNMQDGVAAGLPQVLMALEFTGEDRSYGSSGQHFDKVARIAMYLIRWSNASSAQRRQMRPAGLL
jgi:hypothetical protein